MKAPSSPPSAPLTPADSRFEINCGRMQISTIRQRRMTPTRYTRVEETFPRRSIVAANDERSRSNAAEKRDRKMICRGLSPLLQLDPIRRRWRWRYSERRDQNRDLIIGIYPLDERERKEWSKKIWPRIRESISLKHGSTKKWSNKLEKLTGIS